MGVPVDFSQPIGIAPAMEWPNGCVPVISDSGNQGNSQAVASIPGVSGKTAYLCGFCVTAGGATVGALVSVSIAGLLSGVGFVFGVVAGALLISNPLIVDFSRGLPASGPNQPITITLPALGVGNTNARVFAWGYQL